jgi:hypothetical protein
MALNTSTVVIGLVLIVVGVLTIWLFCLGGILILVGLIIMIIGLFQSEEPAVVQYVVQTPGQYGGQQVQTQSPLGPPGSANFCPYCGRQVVPGASYCPGCGRPIQKSP